MQPERKSGGCMKYFVGMMLLIGAIYFGANACSGSASSPADISPPAGNEFQDNYSTENGVQSPSQDFSVTQSCDEIRADYMNAPAGSQEERWALEAAEEACFTP